MGMGKQESKNSKSIAEQGYTFEVVDQPSGHTKHTELLARLENLKSNLETGLVTIGLARNEARVYIFLAKKGAKKASEVAKLLSFPRTETYHLLGALQKKGLVSCTMHYPVRFVAVPFDSALKTLLGIEKQRVISFERQGKVLLDLWSSIASHEVMHEEIDEEKFQILEGNNSVYGRIRHIVSSAEKEVIIMADQKQLIRLYHNGVTDHLQSLTTKGVDVKILTSVEPRPKEMLKEIKRCELKLLAQPITNIHYIVVDKAKILFFIKDNSDGNATSAIWTDCESLVQCILCLFEELWKRY